MSVSDENRPSVANVHTNVGGKLTGKAAFSTSSKEETLPRHLAGKSVMAGRPAG